MNCFDENLYTQFRNDRTDGNYTELIVQNDSDKKFSRSS